MFSNVTIFTSFARKKEGKRSWVESIIEKAESAVDAREIQMDFVEIYFFIKLEETSNVFTLAEVKFKVRTYPLKSISIEIL